jgi:hypothetical protein
MINNTPAADTKADHEETYDEWFRRMVEKGLAEADSPYAVWFSHEEVMAESVARREEILALIKKEKAN